MKYRTSRGKKNGKVPRASLSLVASLAPSLNDCSLGVDIPHHDATLLPTRHHLLVIARERAVDNSAAVAEAGAEQRELARIPELHELIVSASDQHSFINAPSDFCRVGFGTRRTVTRRANGLPVAEVEHVDAMVHPSGVYLALVPT